MRAERVGFDLDALKARNLPRLEWTAIFKEEAPIADVDRMALAAYFSAFVPPSSKCVGCGASLGGSDPLSAYLGTFRWGLVNGEGVCSRCGYLARVYHRNIGPIEFLPLLLQYHPNELVRREVSQ